jgi:hypothetical protein
VYPRPLTDREQAVLNALLTVDFDGAERLRAQAVGARVFAGCDCGCPSIDFFEGRNSGMSVVVNAGVRNSGTYDGLFLYTVDVPGTGRSWVASSGLDRANQTPTSCQPPRT